MRRTRSNKREILPDSLYHNVVVAKFINHIMQRGKKTVAEKIVYTALEKIKEETKKDPIETFDLAVRNASPALEIKSRRIGGANYQVPVEVRGNRKNNLAMRWIIDAARSKSGKPMAEKLATELLEASKNQGAAIKKKEDTLRMVEANKAFAHYA